MKKKKAEFFKTKKEALQRLEELNYILLGFGGTPRNPLVWAIADKQWFEKNMLKEGFIKKEGKLSWNWRKPKKK